MTKPQKPGEALRWLREHVTFNGDDCLIFPFRRLGHTGYAQVWIKPKFKYANRVMCEWAHGPAPTAAHQSAHSCGNGHLGCVNPKHLSWKTRGENQRERRAHGRENKPTWTRWGHAGTGKLNFAKAAEIRALAGTMTQGKIAEKYGVTRPTINHIINGKTWNRPHRGHHAF